MRAQLSTLDAPPAQAITIVTRSDVKDFGKMPDGTVVQQFTLRNAKGMSAKMMTYAAMLCEVQAPDRNGVFTNVVPGADSLDAYLRNPFGAWSQTIGRVANRVGNARFTLDGVTYQLDANSGRNQLHGGTNGFGRHVWQAEMLPSGANESSVRFTITSKDGDDGYPGNMTASVTYTLNDDNELRLDYSATTDKPTPVNLVNHTYINLAGSGSYTNQELWINADKYTPTDNQLIPTGEIAPVKGTPLDFATPESIGEHASQLIGRRVFDNNFVINASGGSMAVAARVRDPHSGRVLEVRTTQPGLQLYTGNRAAFALETQHFPDSVNHTNFPSVILRPGETFRNTTILAFSAK